MDNVGGSLSMEVGVRRRRAIGAAVLAVCLCLAGPATGTAPAKAERPTAAEIKRLKKKATKKVIKAVRKQLPTDSTPGLSQPDDRAEIKVRSCKQRKKRGVFAGFKCAWIADGELPGLVPLLCRGTAIVKANAKKVKRIDRCENEAEVQAPLLASPHAVRFGYFESFDAVTDLWDELGASGADTVLHSLNWEVLQPTPGGSPASWNWSTYDTLYNQSVAVGARPIWNFIDAPCWAAPGGPCNAAATNPPAAARTGDYAAAAAQIALRYPQSVAVEVWLEPNGPFWGATPDPGLFSSLVGQTADAVHATGLPVGVFAGGLAPGAASPDKQEFGSFLEDALAAGGIQRADAIGFHAVTAVPFAPGNDPSGGYLGRLRIQLQTLNSALAAAGIAKPLSITQLSYSTNGADGYTDAQQAEALVSSLGVLQRIANVSVVVVSRLLDNGDGSKVQGFGVVRANRSKKPAYCQLAAARGVPTPAGC
jgi:hypothetical protein